MLAVHALALARLRGDAALAALVPGKVWDRWIRAGKGEGGTPDAFYTLPIADDPAQLVRMRRTLVVLPGNEAAMPDSEAVEGRFRAVAVHSFFEASAAGREAFDLIDGRVRLLLDGWQAALPDGHAVTLEEEDATAPIPLDGFPGPAMETSRRRFVGEFLR